MAPLLGYLKQGLNTTLPTLRCPPEWAKFIGALASPSAVCALVHPKDDLFDLLMKIVTDSSLEANPTSMQMLQEEVPVLFQLLSSTRNPRKCLMPIMKMLIEKAGAPFSNEDNPETTCRPDSKTELEELAYFPSLPKQRGRGMFNADCQQRKVAKCTKLSSGHPSLLPGIFTLFCPHGECMSTSTSFDMYCTFYRHLLWIPSDACTRVAQCPVYSLVHQIP